MPKCSTAPRQSFSLALLLLLYIVLPKLFLALAATKLPPHSAAGAPLSEQSQEASKETWLQTTTLGLQEALCSTSPRQEDSVHLLSGRRWTRSPRLLK